MTGIYLDNCATTPLAPEVIGTMERVLREDFGNPSSIHTPGRRAARVLREARETVAGALGARPGEIVFTASGTETNNLAVAGTLAARKTDAPLRVVTSAVEHASIESRLLLEQRIRGKGRLEIVRIGVDSLGRIRQDELEQAMERGADLVTILFANNETGALQDLAFLKTLKLRYPNIPMHLDFVQAFGKVELDCRIMPFDLVTVCAHKIHGPKGAGALFVRDGLPFEPLMAGGGQEKFRRPGTEDVAAIAGFARAVEILPGPAPLHSLFLAMETALLETLCGEGIPFEINGSSEPGESRLAGFLNLSFPGCGNKEDLQIALDLEGVYVSSTSACHSGVVTDSHVLKAMGMAESRRKGSIRLLFHRYQDPAVAREAARIIVRVVRRFLT